MRTVTHRIQQLLQIHPAEFNQVLLVGLFALLPSIGGAIGSPGIEALFYARFGVEFLPYMYISLGLATMVSTLTLTAALNKIPKSRLYRLLPISMAGLLLAARFAVALDINGFYPVLWLGMYLYWTLQALFIWGVAGMLFDTRQAKRLFPFFAASSILGNALGGLATGPLVSWIGTENLLLIWALMLALTFLLAVQLTRAYDPPEVHFHRPKPTLQETVVGGGVTVLRSALMRWLSLGTILLAILLFALAFPFSKAVAAQFPDENALAGFLGVFQGATTAIALMISLFLANRVFSKVGLIGVLFIFASIYALGFGGLIFMASFAALVMFRFTQQAWMMGIADTAHQATFNIIPPDKREPARMFIDGIPRQIGVVLSGLILLTIQPVLSGEIVFAANAAMSVICMFAFWRARSAFSISLAEELAEGEQHIFGHEETSLKELAHDRNMMAVLEKGLESEDESIRMTTVEILAQLETPFTRTILKSSFEDPSPQIRTISLQALVKISDGDRAEEILLKALADDSPEVRCEAIKKLTTELLNRQTVPDLLEQSLAETNLEERAIAAAQLLRAGSHPHAESVLETMAQSDDPVARLEAMKAYTLWGGSIAYEVASKGLQDHEAEIRRAALEAITKIDPEQCMLPIKTALGDDHRRVRSAAAKAMAEIGSAALPYALEALDDPQHEDGALEALAQLPLEKGEEALADFIRVKVDGVLQITMMRHKLGSKLEAYPRFKLLAHSLQSHAEQLFFKALRAFQLRTDNEKVSLVISGLRSKDLDQRANAMELLEAIDEESLVSEGLRIWENFEAQEINDDPALAARLRDEVILELIERSESWLRGCAVFAAQASPGEEIKSRIRELAQADPDPLVRETAAYPIAMEESMDSPKTLPVMERILFLRKVPLFSELNPEELKQVASIAGEHIFTDQQTFVQEGELGDEMYVIVSGKVRVVTGEDGDHELVVRGPGEYVGEMAILSHEPRMASLVAEGEVFALCIQQTHFEHMLLEKPEIGLAVMRSLIGRLKESRKGSIEKSM